MRDSHALAQTPSNHLGSPARRANLPRTGELTGGAQQHILAAELAGRSQESDALSMMVVDMVRMVQAGRSSTSRWSAS